MPRNRMIKPEFWSSQTLNRVSLESRLTFIGMWNFADDYGTLLDSNRRILGDIFPLDETMTEAKIGKCRNELVAVKLLVPVEYNGQKFLMIKGWEEHQTVPNKSKRYHIEPSEIKGLLETNESLISDKLDSSDTKNKEQRERTKSKDKEKAWESSFEDFWKLTHFPKRPEDAKGEIKKKYIKVLKSGELLWNDILLATDVFAEANKNNKYAIGLRKFMEVETIKQYLHGDISKVKTTVDKNAETALEALNLMGEG